VPKPRPLSAVVLLSGSGTLLQAVLDAVAAGTLDAEIVAVGSDRAGAYGLERARAAGVPTFVHPLGKDDDRDAWDVGLADLVDSYHPDLVVSAGFMKLVGAAFLARFGDRFINTHPALLPAFPGAHAVRDTLAYGVKVTGCTVFVVDAGIDTGRIIAQEPIAVEPGDTEDTLHERIKVVERRMLVDAIDRFATERTL
jgi:phosphoribosylglycinamide formyltransferase-1